MFDSDLEFGSPKKVFVFDTTSGLPVLCEGRQPPRLELRRRVEERCKLNKSEMTVRQSQTEQRFYIFLQSQDEELHCEEE